MNKNNFFKSYLKLPRNVYILTLADIVNSAGSFVYPFLALFLTLKLGYSEYFAGFLLTVVIAAEGAGRLIGGKFADLIGRKFVIIILSLVGAFLYITIAFLKDSEIIPYLVVIAGFVKSGAFPAINALLIDSTNKKNRNDAFSLFYLGHNIGFAIGPLAAGFLFLNHIELIFLIDAITTILALIPIMLFIKESASRTRSGIYLENTELPEDEKAETGNAVRVFLKKPVLFGFALISIVFSFVYAQTSFSLPVFLENIFPIKGPRYYGILMTINAVIVILVTLLLISAVKKLNPILNILLAGLLFAIGFGMLYYAKIFDYSWIFIFFVASTLVWTLGEILNSVSSNVLLANYSPVTHRGRFNAIFHFISGIGFAIGPLLMGIYIRYFGIKQSWLLVFALSSFCIFDDDSIVFY